MPDLTSNSPEQFLTEKLRGFAAYDAPPSAEGYAHRLDANESPFAPDGALRAELERAAGQAAVNRYPDPACAGLIGAYSDFVGVPCENIVAGAGSDELIGLIVGSFLQKGDKILMFSPDFSMYRFYARLHEAEAVVIQKSPEDGFAADLRRAAAEARENNVRLIILSSPCNPTGRAEDKAALLELIENSGAVVVVDEAYMDFAPDGGKRSLLREAVTLPNLIVLRTMSKVALACLRVGFAVSNAAFIRALNAVRSPYNLGGVSQAMAEAVLRHPDFIREGIKAVANERDILYNRLSDAVRGTGARIYPSAANFFLIRCDALSLYEHLKKDGIITRLSSPEYLRVSVGLRSDSDALIKSITKFYGSR